VLHSEQKPIACSSASSRQQRVRCCVRCAGGSVRPTRQRDTALVALAGGALREDHRLQRRLAGCDGNCILLEDIFRISIPNLLETRSQQKR